MSKSQRNAMIQSGDNDERHKKSFKSVDENRKGTMSNLIVLFFFSYLSLLDKRERKQEGKRDWMRNKCNEIEKRDNEKNDMSVKRKRWNERGDREREKIEKKDKF